VQEERKEERRTMMKNSKNEHDDERVAVKTAVTVTKETPANAQRNR